MDACPAFAGVNKTKYSSYAHSVLSTIHSDDRVNTRLITFPVRIGRTILTALYDSGSDKSFINKNVVPHEDLLFEPCNLPIRLGAEGMQAYSNEVTRATVHAGHNSASVELYHLRSEFDVILGVEDAARLGIAVVGIPTDIPEAFPDDLLEEIIPSCTAEKLIEPRLHAILMRIIQTALDENQKLPINAVCTHENCLFTIDTGDHPPVYIAQYPLARKYREQTIARVNEWASKDYITRAPLFEINSLSL